MLLLCALHVAFAGDGGWTIAPFGIGVYVHHKPVRGAVYTATQLAGAGVATFFTVDGVAAEDAEDDDRINRDAWLTGVGVGAFALSYAVSLIDGSHLHDVQCNGGDQLSSALDLWDRERRMTAFRAPALGEKP